jgi:hypothetical protein
LGKGAKAKKTAVTSSLLYISNKLISKKMANLYRTATTAHPCCLPTLGRSTGAGRTDLPTQK